MRVRESVDLRRSLASWALCTLLAVLAPAAFADFDAHVVVVHDGDTITVRAGPREIRVRLAGIDAPERGQPHATYARRQLSELVAGREVRVVERGRDGYGRVIARVLLGVVDVNAEQVRSGSAWVFRRYSDEAALLALEAEARAARRGLWRDAHPVPPWAWRDRQVRALPIAALAVEGGRP